MKETEHRKQIRNYRNGSNAELEPQNIKIHKLNIINANADTPTKCSKAETPNKFRDRMKPVA